MYCKETIHVVLISFAVVFGPLVFKKEPVDWTSAFKSFYSQHCWPNMNTWMGKYGNFPSQNPKWVQNLQFTLLSETTSIPASFIWESSPGVETDRELGRVKKWWWRPRSMHLCAFVEKKKGIQCEGAKNIHNHCVSSLSFSCSVQK